MAQFMRALLHGGAWAGQRILTPEARPHPSPECTTLGSTPPTPAGKLKYLPTGETVGFPANRCLPLPRPPPPRTRPPSRCPPLLEAFVTDQDVDVRGCVPLEKDL